MRTIHVKSSEEYNFVIGRGILSDTGKILRKIFPPCTAAIITDDIVDSLYAETVSKSLEAAGFSVKKFVFPNGEKSKNLATWGEILNFLAENTLTRTDCVVALGGGVVGDIAGFAASAYLRGIPFVQIPTTFLAAIDSSVGGKTGVDLPAGKNLAGAFYQPKAVFCDPDTMKTLPSQVFADGTAEAVKYGVLSSPKLFDILADGSFSGELEDIIAECVTIKADIVSRDEFDGGVRQLLNLGHTAGHAVEKWSDFAITHGHAVAIGMAVITRAAVKNGLCGSDTLSMLLAALENNSLPTACPCGIEALMPGMLSDKKRRGDTITLVVPETIGKCALRKYPVNELREFILSGLGDLS